MDVTEAELVRRAAGGSQQAFHHLLEQNATSLFAMACAMLGNASDAEDAVQETALAAFRGLPKFRCESKFRTWLVAILVRKVSEHFARRPPMLRLADQDLPDPYVSCADLVDRQVDVRQMLERLSSEHRQVLVLREYEQLSYDEIAEVMGIPIGTVESRLYRARQALKAKLVGYS